MKYLIPLLCLSLLSACSTGLNSFSKNAATPTERKKPAAPSPIGKTQIVRTTAYCHLEDGNRSNAVSSSLASGHYYSAAADWSRFPVGTVFRLVENGRTYLIDDYGSALVGTDTIDLYVPTMREMHRWGVRRVHIAILKKGSYEKSLSILRPRAKRGYIRRMVRDLEHKTH